MNPHRFEQENQQFWQEYQLLLAKVEQDDASQPELTRFFHLYRRICQHLALARQRGYGDALIVKLEGAALAGHQLLYQRRPEWRQLPSRFLLQLFPQAVRRHWRWMLLSTLLFLLPALVIMLWTLSDPMMALTILSHEELDNIAKMHTPENQQRNFTGDLSMFGYYIMHNIGISFQVFAGGIAFGIGSVFYLMFNGIFFGVASAHIVQNGLTIPFFAFVITHSAFEVTAIIISGGAGLLMGYGLLAPGQQRRFDALRQAAAEAILLAGGAACMLVLAALLEAFWSGSEMLPYAVKYAVGTLAWIGVALYLILAGRKRL